MPQQGENPLVKEHIPEKETQRLLVGLLDRDEALQRLETGLNVRDPFEADGDDGTVDDDRESYLRLWERATAAIESSQKFRDDEIEVHPLPDSEFITSHLEEAKGDGGVGAVMSTDDEWRIRLVPIEKLVSFQPYVTTTAHRDISTWEENPESALEYCFPLGSTADLMHQELRPSDDSFFGVQFVSPSPNFRLAQMNVGRTGNNSETIVGVQIKPTPNFIHVTHYEDRYVVNNGYHRLFQLLAAGGTHAPAVVREVDSYDQTGGTTESFFDRDLIMGDRPPLLGDFFTGAAVDVDTPASYRIIRVVAESAVLNRETTDT